MRSESINRNGFNRGLECFSDGGYGDSLSLTTHRMLNLRVSTCQLCDRSESVETSTRGSSESQGMEEIFVNMIFINY
jgi:hypothetical protein